jgi:hypothetical protein
MPRVAAQLQLINVIIIIIIIIPENKKRVLVIRRIHLKKRLHYKKMGTWLPYLV